MISRSKTYEGTHRYGVVCYGRSSRPSNKKSLSITANKIIGRFRAVGERCSGGQEGDKFVTVTQISRLVVTGDLIGSLSSSLHIVC